SGYTVQFVRRGGAQRFGGILANCVAGPARAGNPGEGDGTLSGRFEVLLVPPRPLWWRGKYSGAHGLHGRGRFRTLLPAGLLRASMEHAIGRGPGGRVDSR